LKKKLDLYTTSGTILAAGVRAQIVEFNK